MRPPLSQIAPPGLLCPTRLELPLTGVSNNTRGAFVLQVLAPESWQPQRPDRHTLAEHYAAACKWSYRMPNDNINAKSTDRGNNSGQIGQGSQAAVRQENNALHHKYRNTPQPNGSGENNDQRSQAAAQL